MKHRDVAFAESTLDRIILEAAWIRAHTADIHDLAYGPQAAPDGVHVQTGNTRDVGNRLGITVGTDDDNTKPDKTIGTPPQRAWHTLRKKLRAIETDLAALESMTGRLFTAGELDHSDPAGNKRMPPHIARQVQAAAARRRTRGEYTPARLGERP